MSFELTIAVKRDPAETPSADHFPPAHSHYARIKLNGTLDDDALSAVVQATSEIFDDGAESILIALEDVCADDERALEAFASNTMAVRAVGRQVQVAVLEPQLHARMLLLPDARDWLLKGPGLEVSGVRSAIHVDTTAPTGRD